MSEEYDYEYDLDDKLKKHRMKKRTIIVLIVVIAVAIVAAVTLYNIFKNYSDYDVLVSGDLKNNDSSRYVRYKNGFIKYDGDGIIYYNSEDKIIWQNSYEIRNPQLKVCGDYIAVASISSSRVYVYNAKGYVIDYDTALPITEVEVASNGATVVALEDGGINYVRMFDVNANLIYDIKKVIEGDGYPLDIAISEDASKLCISYIQLDKTKPKTVIAFYNFSEVGKNEVEFLVGSFDYKDIIVPEVRFMGEDKVVCIGDSSIIIFSMSQYPSLEKEVAISGDIDKLFVYEDRIGLLSANGSEDKPYTLTVYNSNGKQLLSYDYEMETSDIVLMKDYVMVYNSSCARIVDVYGRKKFEYNFDIPLKKVLWMSGKDRYLFVNSKSIQQVKLK